MTLAEFLMAMIALTGLALGIRSYSRDRKRDEETAKVEGERHHFERRMTEEAVTIQRQLAEIEARRHEWELEARGAQAAELNAAEERARSANFGIRFGYRDSKRTWARIIAANDGQATARNVRLLLLAETRDGGLVDVEPVGGTDYGIAQQLQPGESVHIGVAFSFGSPQPEDLHYRLTWEDDRGGQTKEGRVPVD